MTATTDGEPAVEAGHSLEATEVEETAQQTNQSSSLPGTSQDGKNEQKNDGQPEEKAGFGNFWVITAIDSSRNNTELTICARKFLPTEHCWISSLWSWQSRVQLAQVLLFL